MLPKRSLIQCRWLLVCASIRYLNVFWTYSVVSTFNIKLILNGSLTTYHLTCKLATCKNMHFLLKSVRRSTTNLYYSSHNHNRLKYHSLLLRKCIKCDYVFKGTSKLVRKRSPGSDTRWPGVPGQGVGVREVRGSNPWRNHPLLLPLFRVR